MFSLVACDFMHVGVQLNALPDSALAVYVRIRRIVAVLLVGNVAWASCAAYFFWAQSTWTLTFLLFEVRER